MKKTTTEAKAVDGKGLKGPRRTKPTKRFRVEYMLGRAKDQTTVGFVWPWHNKWLKNKTFEVKEQAIEYVEKLARAPYNRSDYRVIDAHDDRVITESRHVTK